MPLRNGAHGYGAVTKTLHWLTVAAITTQFVVGYTMDADGPDCDPPGETRSGGDTTDAQEDRLDRLEDACEARTADSTDLDLGAGDWSLLELHVLLGLTILALGLVRVAWRASTPLPPWAESLSHAERRLEATAEKALLVLLFVVPGTGLLLVVGDDDWLPVHVTAHVLFFATLALHLGLVVNRTLLHRDRLLQRML